MRKIKCRSYDSECFHMVYSDGRDAKTRETIYDFCIDKNGLISCYWDDSDYDSFCVESDSGFLDNLMLLVGTRNGMEIYEGDIVNCRHGETYLGVSEHNATIIVSLDCAQSILEIQECETLEVIGNIYENPELLEDKP